MYSQKLKSEALINETLQTSLKDSERDVLKLKQKEQNKILKPKTLTTKLQTPNPKKQNTKS